MNFDESMDDPAQMSQSLDTSSSPIGDQSGNNWDWAMRYMHDTVGSSGGGSKSIPGGQGGGGGGSNPMSFYGSSGMGNTYNYYGSGPSANGGSPIAGGVGAVAKYLVKGFSGGGWYPGATTKPGVQTRKEPTTTPNLDVPGAGAGAGAGADDTSGIMGGIGDDVGSSVGGIA